MQIPPFGIDQKNNFILRYILITVVIFKERNICIVHKKIRSGLRQL